MCGWVVVLLGLFLKVKNRMGKWVRSGQAGAVGWEIEKETNVRY